MLRDVGSRDREFIEAIARVRLKLLQLVNASNAVGYEAVLRHRWSSRSIGR